MEDKAAIKVLTLTPAAADRHEHSTINISIIIIIINNNNKTCHLRRMDTKTRLKAAVGGHGRLSRSPSVSLRLSPVLSHEEETGHVLREALTPGLELLLSGPERPPEGPRGQGCGVKTPHPPHDRFTDTGRPNSCHTDKLFSSGGSRRPAGWRMGCWRWGCSLPLVLLVLLAVGQRVTGGRSSQHHGPRRHPRSQQSRQNITLGIILPERNTDYAWAWPRIGPAVERAVRTINTDPTLLPNHQLTYVFKNSEDKVGVCSESIAPLMAVDLKFFYDPWAFIGPGCSYTSSPVGLFTTHWDVPMLGKFALRICEHFGWREHVLLMFSDNKVDDRPCYFAVEGLYTELKSINITLVDRVLEENKLINYTNILSEVHSDGR
ncbi:hypothetical protein INR49_007885, partial [Caranx melampygus]